MTFLSADCESEESFDVVLHFYEAISLVFPINEAAAASSLRSIFHFFLPVSLVRSVCGDRSSRRHASYMSAEPIIRSPIMKLFTTEKERKIKDSSFVSVSKSEKDLLSRRNQANAVHDDFSDNSSSASVACWRSFRGVVKMLQR